MKQHYQLDDAKLVVHMEDGTKTEILIQHILRFKKVRGVYLLYISRSSFLFIPETSFHSEKEFSFFQENVLKIV